MTRFGGAGAPPGRVATLTYTSQLRDDVGGACQASGGTPVDTADLYPVTQVADLGAEFTPPFYPDAPHRGPLPSPVPI